MEPEEIEELKAFLQKLPRPLPAGLKLHVSITVTNPAQFIECQLALIKSGSRSAYDEVCSDRLLRWKGIFSIFHNLTFPAPKVAGTMIWQGSA